MFPSFSLVAGDGGFERVDYDLIAASETRRISTVNRWIDVFKV